MTVSDGGCGLTERGAKTMKTNSQHNNDRASPLDNEQKIPSDAPTGSELRDVFHRFLALEAEGKSLNDHKAALFARAKADGYDSKALRTAFRQRVREMQYPEETTKHGELTDSYLLILRSEGSGDAGTSDCSPLSLAPAEPAPDALARSHADMRTRDSGSHDTDLLILRREGSGDAGTSDPSPVSLAPVEPAPDALARSHAHTRSSESVSHHTDGAVISLAGTKHLRVESSDMDVGAERVRVECSDMDVGADDEPDIRVFVRCCEVQAGPISETKPANGRNP
jgi:uncharacterized protein (UPF0335 family)